MKWVGIIFISFLISCSMNKTVQSISEPKPPCLWDIGIKKNITTATLLSNTDEKRIQIIEYNIEGRPLIRKNPDIGDYVEFLYEGKNLKGTIEQNTFRNSANSNSGFNEIDNVSKIDTNFVLRNDEFGRPLEMSGKDGNILKFTYTECETDFQEYKDLDGNLIHNLEMTYKNGILVKTVMKSEYDDWSEQITSYYDYKFDKRGHWIERKYTYPSGKVIIEKRALTYY